MTPVEPSPLEQAIHYRFQNPNLLSNALCHSTYVNENKREKLEDNQRLEFLGDAVLGLVVGHLLMERYPRQPEGELSRLRAGLVKEDRLAAIARSLDMGRHLKLGKGELATGGADKPSILADAFEALLAAIYLDGGFQAAFDCIERCFTPFLDTESVDPKTRLQEIVQRQYKAAPVYSVASETGPDHDKTFRVTLHFASIQTEGTGKSKKQAEQNAARRALRLLKAL